VVFFLFFLLFLNKGVEGVIGGCGLSKLLERVSFAATEWTSRGVSGFHWSLDGPLISVR
jgi:hypothetical protein